MFQKIHDDNFEDNVMKNEGILNSDCQNASELNEENLKPFLNQTVQINDQYYNVVESSGKICLENLVNEEEVPLTLEDIQKNPKQYINQSVILDEKIFSVNLDEKGDLLLVETGNLNIQYPCPNCQKVFSNASALTKHYKELYNEKIFVCRQCPRIFLELSDLFLHARRDHVDPSKPPRDPSKYRYHCTFPNCDYMTNNGGTFQHHCRAHTKIKPFQCAYCDKRFTQKTNRNTHQSRHNDEKKFDCAICKKKFKTYDIYLSHLRTREHELREHTEQLKNDSLKVVCLGCNEKFSNVYHMKNHRKVCNLKLEHNYQCETCKLLIKDLKELLQHIKEHSDKFTCPVCYATGFEHMNKLNHHITRTHGIKVSRKEVCRYCEITLDSTEELHNHVQQYHKDEINSRKSRGAIGKIVCQYPDCTFTANTEMHMNNHIEKHKKGTLEAVKAEPKKRGRKRKLPDTRDLFNVLYDNREENTTSTGINNFDAPYAITESGKRKRGRPRKIENLPIKIENSQENVGTENNNNPLVFDDFQVKMEQKEFNEELFA